MGHKVFLVPHIFVFGVFYRSDEDGGSFRDTKKSQKGLEKGGCVVYNGAKW